MRQLNSATRARVAKVAVAALGAAGLVLGIAGTVAAAQAPVAHGPAPQGPLTGQAPAGTPPRIPPPTASGCGGDVCIYLSTPSGGYVYVEGWAYDAGFYGHMNLTGPDGINENSPSGTFPAGGRHYTFTTVPAITGTYCVTGWSGDIDEGTACEAVE